MRPTRIFSAALALVAFAAPLGAQDTAVAARQSLARAISELRRDLPEVSIPAPASVTSGSRVIAAGERVAGPVAVSGGNLAIHGTVVGDAVAIDGDVLVAAGGGVEGDVLAVRGSTQISGIVTGVVLRLEGTLEPPPVVAARTPVAATWGSIGVALSTFAIFLMMGIGILIFAGPTLEGVTEVLERQLARSFLIGVAGQLGIVPGVVLLVIALALTVLGLLLIPFGIVAYVLAVAGAFTLALLAVAVLIGRAIARWRRSVALARRAQELRALILGVSVLFAPWIIGAFLAWSPFAAGIVRIVALVITWIAVTAGFGAVLISRAGTRRPELARRKSLIPDEVAWQTPTPVSGVAAARRPTPVATGGHGR